MDDGEDESPRTPAFQPASLAYQLLRREQLTGLPVFAAGRQILAEEMGPVKESGKKPFIRGVASAGG